MEINPSIYLLSFLLYINNLPVNIHDANLVMFADYINVLISDSDEKTLQNKMDSVFAELETWITQSSKWFQERQIY